MVYLSQKPLTVGRTRHERRSCPAEDPDAQEVIRRGSRVDEVVEVVGTRFFWVYLTGLFPPQARLECGSALASTHARAWRRLLKRNAPWQCIVVVVRVASQFGSDRGMKNRTCIVPARTCCLWYELLPRVARPKRPGPSYATSRMPRKLSATGIILRLLRSPHLALASAQHFGAKLRSLHLSVPSHLHSHASHRIALLYIVGNTTREVCIVYTCVLTHSQDVLQFTLCPVLCPSYSFVLKELVESEKEYVHRLKIAVEVSSQGKRFSDVNFRLRLHCVQLRVCGR